MWKCVCVTWQCSLAHNSNKSFYEDHAVRTPLLVWNWQLQTLQKIKVDTYKQIKQKNKVKENANSQPRSLRLSS